MQTLLRIDASSRTEESQSRAIADRFVEHWCSLNPDVEIVVRDLVRNPVPHITETTIAAFYTPKANHDNTLRHAAALSDELINELISADVLLINTPMYNFSIPSALKAWIDHIVRIGETFTYSPEYGFEGLVKGKKVFVISASGAVYSTDEMRPMNFLLPYLNMLLNFLAMNEVEFISVEGTSVDEQTFKQSKVKALDTINTIGVSL